MQTQGALFGFAGDVAEQGVFCGGVVVHEVEEFEEAVAPFFTGYEEGGKGRELMHPQVGVCAGDFAGDIVGIAHSAQEVRAVCSHAADVYAVSGFVSEGVGIRTGYNGDLVFVRETTGDFIGAQGTTPTTPGIVDVVV